MWFRWHECIFERCTGWHWELWRIYQVASYTDHALWQWFLTSNFLILLSSFFSSLVQEFLVLILHANWLACLCLGPHVQYISPWQWSNSGGKEIWEVTVLYFTWGMVFTWAHHGRIIHCMRFYLQQEISKPSENCLSEGIAPSKERIGRTHLIKERAQKPLRTFQKIDKWLMRHQELFKLVLAILTVSCLFVMQPNIRAAVFSSMHQVTVLQIF